MMPFPNQQPRLFTKSGVEWLYPNQHGVYGLYRADAWIYIGRGDLRTRLLAHLNGDNPHITKERPTHYLSMVTDDDERVERELISELQPIVKELVG